MGHLKCEGDVSEASQFWTADCDLVDTIGSCSEDTKIAISKTLSYLGVSWASLDDGAKHGFAIAVQDEVVTTPCSQIRFDCSSKAWQHLSPTTENSKAAITSPDSLKPRVPSISETDEASKAARSAANAPLKDWTTLLPKTDHVDFLKSREWHKTSLGPIESWPYALRLMTIKMINDPRPANLYWGPSRVAIYNEPFSCIAASRHPMMMGSTAMEALPATYSFLSDVFDGIEESGIAFSRPQTEMTVKKIAGFTKEAWYDEVLSPIYDTDGTFLGLYNSGYEITDYVLAQRNARMIHQIVTDSSPVALPWEHLLNVFSAFERDIPFLAMYSTDDYEDTHSSGSKLLLQGSLGIRKGHPALPERIDIHENDDGFRPTLRAAKTSRASVALDMPDGKLPDFLAGNMEWRGHGDPCTQIIITPLNTSRTTIGFLIMGLNSRRQYDKMHREFGEDIGQVANGLLTQILSLDQAREREEQLIKELTQRQRFLQRVAEFATVGMYTHSVAGILTWTNSTYFDVCGLAFREEEGYDIQGIEFTREEDQDKAMAVFQQCISTTSTRTMELRLQTTWRPPDSEHDEPRWVMTSIAPNMENGEVVDVFGCVMDISHLKWAEKLQTKLAGAAIYAKEQQERFIDITSHEMRNPLGAIMQCADDITTTCHKYKTTRKNQIPDHLIDAFETILESSKTISFCSTHQNQIVDDILTVSKLENEMLTITPMPVDPVTIATQVLRTFSAGMTETAIKSSLSVQSSYTDLNIGIVSLDPTRLTQILVNLITNAVKFTRLSERKVINLRLSASKTRPSDFLDTRGQWFPGPESTCQTTDRQPRSESVYIIFEVEDSGIGISQDEARTLFHRFAQATPRTHIHYGGSGLGLFISRKLVELQGGSIGISSEPGAGSTFTFYVETQRTNSLEGSDSHTQAKMPKMPKSLKVNVNIEQDHKLSQIERSNNLSSPIIGTASNTPQQSLPSILLVEDNLINQQVLSKQLKRLECEVYLANHGKDALDVIKKSTVWNGNDAEGLHIDIVLMDWEMPIMDGLTCTKQIRGMEGAGSLTKHLPIIGTTANARAEQIETAIAAGMDDVIPKPFTVTQLMERIERLIHL